MTAAVLDRVAGRMAAEAMRDGLPMSVDMAEATIVAALKAPDRGSIFDVATVIAWRTLKAADRGMFDSLAAELSGNQRAVLDRRLRDEEGAASALDADSSPLVAVDIVDFIAGLAPPSYALDGVLIGGYCFAVTGQSGHGKTAIALTLCAAVALGLPFAGHETEQARVLYIAGENPDDVRIRVVALLEALDIPPEAIAGRIQFVDQSFTLAERHAELMHLIESGGFGLVVLDTDQALSSDADENDNRQRVEHAKRVRMLTRASTKPTVVDLCHPPVNAGRTALRPRGGSSFLAEVDGNIGVWMEEGETRAEMFRTAKFRGPMFEPMTFEIKVIELDSIKDRKGRPMTAAIALPADEADADTDEATRRRRIGLLADISSDPAGSIRDRARRTGAPKSTISRDIRFLTDRGAIVEGLHGHELTAKGKKWLAAT